MSMLTDSDPHVGFLMHDAARLLRARFDERARGVGVTRQQWRVLLNLARNEGQTQAELADVLEVERITLCRMIDRLADNGLVERRADPRDRRVWRLHLLPAARIVVEELAAIGARLEEETLAVLDPDQRAALKMMLSKVREGLRTRAPVHKEVA